MFGFLLIVDPGHGENKPPSSHTFLISFDSFNLQADLVIKSLLV